jgi:hypothetical protein
MAERDRESITKAANSSQETFGGSITLAPPGAETEHRNPLKQVATHCPTSFS